MSWLFQQGMGSYTPEEGWDYSWNLLGGALLVERHTARCRCTYCQIPRKVEYWMVRDPELRRVGYTPPQSRGKTSWYRLHWKRAECTWYLRWTKQGFRRMFRRPPPTTPSTGDGEDTMSSR